MVLGGLLSGAAGGAVASTIIVRIMADTSKLNTGVDKANTKVNTLNKSSKGLSGSFGKLALAGGLVIGAMMGISRIMKTTIAAFRAQEQAEARLEQALKNQGFFTEQLNEDLLILAKRLQQTTVFSDEQTISGMAMLASFKLNAGQIAKVTPLMQDMATMTSTTTGEMMGLEAAGKLVGLALEGQAGRLKMAGISLTDMEVKALSLASASDKVALIMQIMKNNAGGLAEATGQTASAAIQKLNNSIGDLKEAFGKMLVEGGQPTIETFDNIVRTFTFAINKADEIGFSLTNLGANLRLLANRGKEVEKSQGGINKRWREWLELVEFGNETLDEFTARIAEQTGVTAEMTDANEEMITAATRFIELEKQKVEITDRDAEALGKLRQITFTQAALTQKYGKDLQNVVKWLDTTTESTKQLTSATQRGNNAFQKKIDLLRSIAAGTAGGGPGRILSAAEMKSGAFSVGRKAGSFKSAAQNAQSTAAGGVVMSPQIRRVGESGPEAIVPLNKMGGGGLGGITINISDSVVTNDAAIADLAEQIQKKIHDNLNSTVSFATGIR